MRSTARIDLRMVRLTVAAAVVCGVIACALPASMQAHEVSAGALKFLHPHVMWHGGDTSAVYMRIESGADGPDRLLSVSSAASTRTELHVHDGAEMVPVAAIDIPAGATRKLEADGPHIMLYGLRGPFFDGETLNLTLHFERAGDVSVNAFVETGH